MTWANLMLLVSNLFPIMPLDGGRIAESALRSILDPALSGLIVSIVSLMAAMVALTWCLKRDDIITPAFLAAMVYFNVKAMQWALWIVAARRSCGVIDGAQCPICRAPAIDRANSMCGACGDTSNLIRTGGECLYCGATEQHAYCSTCRLYSSVGDWLTPAVLANAVDEPRPCLPL